MAKIKLRMIVTNSEGVQKLVQNRPNRYRLGLEVDDLGSYYAPAFLVAFGELFAWVPNGDISYPLILAALVYLDGHKDYTIGRYAYQVLRDAAKNNPELASQFDKHIQLDRKLRRMAKAEAKRAMTGRGESIA